ncbi:MAG: type II toxin-antitoxin system VapC family toxin [Gammaproteobacteria bacterium]|nr:type II toxin-antitoxin system VapC family toxin [Gammaproteobacteria bacterium]
MAYYLFDTNHCIYLMNGWNNSEDKVTIQERNVVKTFNRMKNDIVYMSEASIGELVYGIERSQKKECNQKRLEVLLLAVPSIPITKNVWEIYGKIKAELSKIGKIIPDIDLLIASTAKCHDMILVANDKHMKNLPDSVSSLNSM